MIMEKSHLPVATRIRTGTVFCQKNPEMIQFYTRNCNVTCVLRREEKNRSRDPLQYLASRNSMSSVRLLKWRLLLFGAISRVREVWFRVEQLSLLFIGGLMLIYDDTILAVYAFFSLLFQDGRGVFPPGAKRSEFAL